VRRKIYEGSNSRNIKSECRIRETREPLAPRYRAKWDLKFLKDRIHIPREFVQVWRKPGGQLA